MEDFRDLSMWLCLCMNFFNSNSVFKVYLIVFYYAPKYFLQ